MAEMAGEFALKVAVDAGKRQARPIEELPCRAPAECQRSRSWACNTGIAPSP